MALHQPRLAALLDPADDRHHCLCCVFGFPSVMFTTLYLTGRQAALTTAEGLIAALRAADRLAAHGTGAGWTRQADWLKRRRRDCGAGESSPLRNSALRGGGARRAWWTLASRCRRPTGRHALSNALRELNRKQDGSSRMMCTRFDHLDHK
ncbi:hypothetical protein [Paracoccus tibetensis]|uniref:hypothetical protein n=1 Tax=Paracoccus tibetensis TaxID=336292 RepID=UPI0011140BC3|nr:hypothetical protein [Paracoccus tibetensis]